MRNLTGRGTRRRGDEEGSALVIALFFVVIFSLFVASVISFAEVGLKASASFDGKAKDLYATDGAVSAAINRFRRGGPCDDYTAPAGPDGQPLSGRGVIVRCVDDNRPAGGGATRPVNALLSLGAEGITTKPGFEQRVLGDIFSNSTVAAEATLIVQGEVSATGDCTGPIQTSPPVPLRCANKPDRADVTKGRDPHYAKAIPTVPAYRTAPACPPGKWLVTLKPGYYDDAAALSKLTTTEGACPGRVVWLEPGNYYLDFTFRDPDSTWIINDPTVVVVAGTPRGWVPDPLGPLPAPSLSVPGSCKTAADPAPVGGGVQLVAGGGTHLQIDQGRVEVCAEPSKTGQSIALYGMAPDRPLVPTAWKDVSGFTAPGNATTIGENPVATATADLATGPASVTFTDFRPGIPEGSLIDSATLRVVHQDEGDMDDGSVKVAANFTGSSCAGLFPRLLPKRSGGLAEDRVDLKADCGLTTSNSAAFAGLTVTYSASLRAGGVTGTDALDGIAVDVVYRAPITRKPAVISAVSGAGFADSANALEIESGQQPTALTADATLNSGAPTASITVAGLGDPPIPPSAVIDSAVLRVAHQEPDSAPPTDIAPPTVTFSGSTCPPKALTVSPAAVTNDRTVDLKACGLNTADKLKGLTATYEVALAAGGTAATAKLDGMWLELIYRLSHSPATVTPTVFTDPDNAEVIDGAATSNATLSPSGSTSASLVLADYSQPAVPADSIIDSAVLRVAHRDEGPMNPPTLVVAGIGPGPCPTALAKRPSTIGEDRIDLKACGLTAPSQLAGLSVTYTATLMAGATANATARVDGVVLDLSYRPPAVRRPATATTPAPGAASTAFTAPDNAKAVDTTTADVTLANGATAASVALAGYDSPVPLPAGSVIDSAVLRVAHQDQPGIASVSLTAAFPDGPGGTTNLCTTPQPLSSQPTAIGVDRIDLKACGLTTPEQVAGLTATYTANAPGTSTTTTHAAATATATGFSTPDNGKVIDGTTTDAPLGTTNPSTITLAGYDQTPPAAGSTTTSAVLRVAHRDDAGVGQLTATVLRSGVACMTQPLTPSATLVAESFPIDLAACGLTDPSQLSGLTITYQASLATTATAATASLDGAVLDLTYQASRATDRLDGIELDVVFRPPAFRPLDGCTVDPYPGTGCALVNVAPLAGDTATRFAAQGTVYAPTAALDISMNGLTDQVLTRGLVARTIRLGLKADPAYKRPVMGVPPEPVKFTAYPDVTARATTATTPAPGPATTAFSDPNNAKAIGESPTALTANASLDPANPAASITLGAFTQDALPDGSVIDAAVLRIVHREEGDVGSVAVTVGGFTTGPCETQPFQLPRYSLLGEDQIDLRPCGFTDPAQLSGLTITYTVELKSAGAAGIAYLDGITVDLLSGPLLRARVAFDATRDSVDVQGWSVLR